MSKKICPDTTQDSPPDYEEALHEMDEHPHDGDIPMPVIPKTLHEDDIAKISTNDHLPPLIQPKPIIDLEQEFKSQSLSQLPSTSYQQPIVEAEEDQPVQVKPKKKRTKEEKRLRKEAKRKW